jgi:hypothetical protein
MRSKKLLTLLIAPLFAVGMTACDVDQTEEGEMPEVQIEEGELPAYDVDAAEVNIEEDTVTVPDIDIDTPEDDTLDTSAEGMESDGGR